MSTLSSTERTTSAPQAGAAIEPRRSARGPCADRACARPGRRSPSSRVIAVLLGIGAAARASRSCSRALTSPPPRCPGGCSPSPSPRPRAACCTSSAAVEARSVSMSELPLVLGLFFASPLALLVGRLVGCAATADDRLRRSPAAQDLLQPRAVRRRDGRVDRACSPPSARGAAGHVTMTWVGAYAGALAANVLGGCAIGLVIAVHDGGVRLRCAARATPVAGQVHRPDGRHPRPRRRHQPRRRPRRAPGC